MVLTSSSRLERGGRPGAALGERAGRGGERPSRPPPFPTPGEPAGLRANPSLPARSCIKKGGASSHSCNRKPPGRIEEEWKPGPSPPPPTMRPPPRHSRGWAHPLPPTLHLPGPGRRGQPLWTHGRPPPNPSTDRGRAGWGGVHLQEAVFEAGQDCGYAGILGPPPSWKGAREGRSPRPILGLQHRAPPPPYQPGR